MHESRIHYAAGIAAERARIAAWMHSRADDMADLSPCDATAGAIAAVEQMAATLDT